MDKFHKASAEAWNHAKDQTGVDGKDISRAAGWILRSGFSAGRLSQMEWFVSKGLYYPSLDSLFRIAILYPRFVALYLEGAVYLASKTEAEETEV